MSFSLDRTFGSDSCFVHALFCERGLVADKKTTNRNLKTDTMRCSMTPPRIRRCVRPILTLACSLVFGLTQTTEAQSKKSSLFEETFPFQGAAISAKGPGKNVAMKGLAIRVSNGASVLFDTELLRMASGWTGGYISSFGVAFDGGHGGHPTIDGDQAFGTPVVPGWVGGKNEFKDTRAEPFGALPPETARWDGLYVVGMETVLSYTIRGTKVYEQPSSVQADGQTAFVRTFDLAKATEDLTLLVCEVDGGQGQVTGEQASLKAGGKSTLVVGSKLPAKSQLVVADNRILLKLPKGSGGVFKLTVWNGNTADVAKVAALTEGAPKLANFKKAGPARWTQEVVTKGQLETSQTPDGAYVTDSLTAPLDNPWKRRVRFSGLDFFKDGKRAALSTWDGDVWIVSGIDAKLENLRWKRFSSGMYETIGLRIVDDVIYTSGRDQLTRYHDLNKDGEADYYENFNNQYTSTEGFHEFLFDLQTDKEGNFYFAKAGPVRGGGRGFERISANAGTLMKVSKDGKKMEVVATGFRAPNGIGVNPWTGQITTGDNEGTWIPTCPVNWVKPGGFYGVEDTVQKAPVPAFNPPMLWLSHNGWDNSGGGQVWVDSDKWGPFKGELLHCSYGECAIYLIMKQDLGTQMQGAAVRLPVKFTSSAMRPKFNPGDGQLYVAGLQGWQTKAVKLAGLDRIRYTGQTVASVRDVKVDKRGMHLTFTQPVEAKDAEDVQNYSIETWNYRRTSNYGSPEVSVKNPDKNGHDKLEVSVAKVSPDGHSVTLTIPELVPAMQVQIKYTLKSKSGKEIKQSILSTIHAIP